MTEETDPLALLAASINKLSGSIDEALVQVGKNAGELEAVRDDLHRWQRALVVLAVLVVGGMAMIVGVGSYWQQVNCDRTNDGRRVLNDGGEVFIPLRDCSWPAG